MIYRKRWLWILLGAVGLTAALSLGSLLLFLPSGGPRSITSEELRQSVFTLASDTMAGRETGSREIAFVEEYIAESFESFNLSPLPNQSDYFLEFGLFERHYDPSNTKLSFTKSDELIEGVPGEDFKPFPFSEEGSVSGEVVFAGYGITAPEYGYDDYVGLDVTGKVVLLLRHEPNENDPDSPFNGTSFTHHALFRTKAENARKHGAVGMLLFTDPVHHSSGDDLRLVSTMHIHKPDPDSSKKVTSIFLALHISKQLAQHVIGELPIKELQLTIDRYDKPASLALRSMEVNIQVSRSVQVKELSARNVAAFLKGRDPTLKDEWIVVAGHHDHLGFFTGQGDTIYNGADDNASGTAGVLELAEAFADLPRRTKPRRSFVFVTFTGEEKGLLGSRAMIEQRMIPVNNVIFMMNLDMIGRNPDDTIQFLGGGFAPELRQIVEEKNKNIGLSISFGGTEYMDNSDHDPFFKNNIPFLGIFTGEHEDYHQVTDHADRLDYSRMSNIIKMAFEILATIADSEEPPKLTGASQ